MRALTGMSALIAISFLTCSTFAQARKRIAIVPADRIVRSTPYGYQAPEVQQRLSLETKVADALLAKLSGNASLEILDRSQTEALEQEQDNKLSDRFDATQAAKLGKLQGVNILIFIGINDFQATSSTGNTNAVVFTKTTTKGVVHLSATAKVISVETGAVLAAPSVLVDKNEVLSSSKSAPASVYSVPVQRGSLAAAQNPALLQLVDKAIAEAADGVATKIEPILAAPLAPAKHAGLPKVVGIDDGKVMINRGSTQGLKVGDLLKVTRIVDTGFKDPDTQQPILRKKTICSLSVSSVEDSISFGTCEGETPESGDVATPAGVNR